jgi:hypothetical protein
LPIASTSAHLPFEGISYALDGGADGLFGSGALDGKCVGRGTGLGLLYAWHFRYGTHYGSLAMAAMHILNAIDGHVGIRWLVGSKLTEKLHNKSQYN